MNSLAVPRKAKEAIGAIARLTKADGSGAMTVNVEYNQLDPLLRSTINTAGDVNDASGEQMHILKIEYDHLMISRLQAILVQILQWLICCPTQTVNQS